MKKLSLLALFFFVAGALVLPAHAQDSAKNAASPNLAASPSAALLKQWNEIGRKLIAMAEDFPEDKYDFKPTPPMRSFAEQLLHVAGSMEYFTGPVQGKTPAKESENPPRATYKTKADVVAFMKKEVEDGAAAIKAKGDKGMADLIADPESKQQMHVSDLAYGLIEHSGEHYGQLVIYYRLSGLVPP